MLFQQNKFYIMLTLPQYIWYVKKILKHKRKAVIIEIFLFRYYPRQGGGRGGEGAPRRGGMGRRGPPANQGGAQGDEAVEGGVVPPQRSYYRRNFRGGRGRGGPGGPMGRGGYRRMRPHNQSQRQNGQEGEAQPASEGSPKAQAKPPKPTSTTIDTTTNESQAWATPPEHALVVHPSVVNVVYLAVPHCPCLTNLSAECLMLYHI